jgi:hypothetical protein
VTSSQSWESASKPSSTGDTVPTWKHAQTDPIRLYFSCRVSQNSAGGEADDGGTARYRGRWCSQIAAHEREITQAQLADGSIAATAELRFFVPARQGTRTDKFQTKEKEKRKSYEAGRDD